jgi:transposase InsO family protein
MPWKTRSNTQLRRRVIREMSREQINVSELCRQHGISRKTAYKWKARFEKGGTPALEDRAPVARRIPGRLWARFAARLQGLHRLHPRWGPKKIWALLKRSRNGRKTLSVSTVKRCFERWSWSRKRARRPRHGAILSRAKLTQAKRPNQVWTADFKGWFRTGNGSRVDLLTVRDQYSRYIVAIHLQSGQTVAMTLAAMQEIFRQHGLPECIQTDNGGPFGSTGCLGLTRLSAWWVKLGIRVEFIDPGHPEQNGAHEQMHRVLKAETTQPPAPSLRAQRVRTQKWRREYNEQRPHEALDYQRPEVVYRVSRQKLPKKELELSYPRQWKSRWVKSSGEICLEGRRWFVGEAFAGQRVGLEKVGVGVRRVHFANMLLGEMHSADGGSIRPRTYARKGRAQRSRSAGD